MSKDVGESSTESVDIMNRAGYEVVNLQFELVAVYNPLGIYICGR